MGRIALRGALEHIRLGSLLQLAEAEMISGRLVLEGRGTVELHRGQPTAARFGSEVEGTSALRELFFADAGEFHVDLDDVAEAPPLGPVIALVLDGCRLVDEWERLAPLHLAWEPAWETSANEGIERLIAAVRDVLERLDGRRTTDAVVVDSGRCRAEVVDPLRLLLDEGFLEQVDPPEAPSPAAFEGLEALDDRYDSLVAQGRALLRAADLAGSEDAFRAALSLRPDDRVVAQNLRHVRLRRAGRWPLRDGWRQLLPAEIGQAPLD